MATHLVWFRHDLRARDNSALHAACSDKQAKVIALYIATPEQWQQHGMSARQAAYLYQSLESVQEVLAERGIALYYHQCSDFTQSVDYLAEFCQQHAVEHLFYNYQYEVNERERDRQAEHRLEQQGVIVEGFDDSVLLPPGSVLTGDGEMYKVFTPFSKAFVKKLQQDLPHCYPLPEKRQSAPLSKTPALKPFDYPREDFDQHRFPSGEEAVLKRLRSFCREQVIHYEQQRDFPALDGTSGLSAALAIGVLSPRQCVNRLAKEHPDFLSDGSAFCWLNELIWRDFYRHLLVAYPRLSKHQPFHLWTNNVRWRKNHAELTAWQEGKTGYPIVDAAMRQLNQTGWMHNRLRMVVASFLVKDLLIDWREGERYFLERLIDGDLAANNGGWQWAASSGTDAAPYFRIFNPVTQGERFDQQGEFIRHWLPELHQVPDSAIHSPHLWAKKNRVGLDYPAPVVDHKMARQRTLEAFEKARKG